MSDNIRPIWELYPHQSELTSQLSTHLSCSQIICQCLLNRGILSLDEAKQFIDPEITDYEYFDEETFSKAAELIKQAKQDSLKIFLYGDYDVDGMTSTSMLYLTFKALKIPVEFYIPKRVSEGYGLNEQWIHQLKAANPDILMTLDCGISDVKEIQLIKRVLPDLKVLVFDHHQLPDQLPDADLMINPQFCGSDHPSTILCTAGIVYLFLQFLSEKTDLGVSDLHLDLAAMGTVADVVPLKGMNRRITAQGLKKIADRENLGLSALMNASKLNKPLICATDIGFVLGPRLNAAGRLADPRLGVRLLTSQTEDAAIKISQELGHLNMKRQQMGQKIYTDAKAMLQDQDPAIPIIVLSSPMWHPGIIGIIASKLSNEFHKPAILIAEGADMARGSARSVPGVSIYDILKQADPLMEAFGGHHAAAGFNIDLKNIESFIQQLQHIATQMIQPQQLRPVFEVDARLDIEDMTVELADSLAALAPFGQENPEPIFLCEGLTVIDAKCVGKSRNHLKLTLSSADQKRSIDAIGFSMGHYIEMALGNRPIDILCHLQINEWMGRQLPQLQIVDIR